MTLKFQVNGSKDSYLQLKLINKTSFSNFSCKAYKLRPDANGNFIPDLTSERSYFLKENGDGEFCSMNAQRGEWIGLSFPEGINNITFTTAYRNAFIIDGIDVTLLDVTSATSNYDMKF